MAKPLFESWDRDEAHQFQSKVVADGTAPFSACTEHVSRGDTVVVWDDTPTAEDLERLSRTEPPVRPAAPAPASKPAPASRRRSTR
jgi:hypothetical protein